jgi:stage II sporulation protein D
MRLRATKILSHSMLRAALVLVACLAISLFSLSDARPASRPTSIRKNSAPLSAADVRIGVLTLFHTQEFTVVALPGNALVLQAAEKPIVLEPSSGLASADVRLSGSKIVISADSRVVSAPHLAAAGRNREAVDFVLKIPGKIARRYQGTLEIRADGANLLAVVSMDRELAVASIVAAESEADTPPEALKAQAIATRSYLASGRGRHLDFDFCDTTHCQFLRELPLPESNAALAAAATRAMVLTYNSSPFPAMYTRRCAGHTRTPQQIGLPSATYPYYSVACDFCLAHPDRWTTRMSHSDAAALRTSNEHDRLAINRRLGWDTVPSNDFVVSQEEAQSSVSGIGRGHGIGLCQAGSKAMAQHGASYQQILEHYYPGTTIANLPTNAESRSSSAPVSSGR